MANTSIRAPESSHWHREFSVYVSELAQKHGTAPVPLNAFEEFAVNDWLSRGGSSGSLKPEVHFDIKSGTGSEACDVSDGLRHLKNAHLIIFPVSVVPILTEQKK
jgi:hypothetical protein